MPQVILRFVFFGVAFGGGVFLFAWEVAGSARSFMSWPIHWLDPLKLLFAILIPGLFLFPFCLGFSVVPAIVTGFLYVAILRRTSRDNPSVFVRMLIGALVGASVSTLFGAALSAIFSLLQNLAPVTFQSAQLIGWFAAGGVAGAFGAFSVGARAYAAAMGEAGNA